MGMFAGKLLDVELPQTEKRVLAIVETDGCFSDGVAVAANCWVGRRTLRVEDYGKSAVTFVDTHTDRAVRISPRPEGRELAGRYAPEAGNRWEAMLFGYQRMPDRRAFAVGRSHAQDARGPDHQPARTARQLRPLW